MKSSSVLCNDYDGLVKLAYEKSEPIYITRNGEGEMVFLPIEAYGKREAELNLLQQLCMAERNRLAGSPAFSVSEMRSDLKNLYDE